MADTKYPPTPPMPSFVGRNRLQQKAAWEGALRAYVLNDRASRTPEPVGVPAGYFIDTSAPGQPPHYEQVAAEHSQDPDAVPLYATHPVVAEQQGQPRPGFKWLQVPEDWNAYPKDWGQPEQPPSGHVAAPSGLGATSEERPAKFDKTYCSQCGTEFGPGNEGYSHCSDHRAVLHAPLEASRD